MGRSQEAVEAYCASVARNPLEHLAVDELLASGVIVDTDASAAATRLDGSNGLGFKMTKGGWPLMVWRRIFYGEATSSKERQQGDKCRDDRRWADAVRWYREHLNRFPRDFAIWVQLGNCLKEAGSLIEALAAYQQAKAVDDADADVFVQLGHLFKLLGRRDDAIESYRASLRRQARNNTAARELLALGLSPGVVRAIVPMRNPTLNPQERAPNGPTFPTSDTLAQADRHQIDNRWDDAADWYLKHLSDYPADLHSWLKVGKCLMLSSRWEEAIVVYWRAMALDADNWEVFLGLGRAMILQEKWTMRSVPT